MNTEEKREMERIERAIRVLIYGQHQELYKDAKERGKFVFESIIGIFPVSLFTEYPELEAIYKNAGAN